ALGGSPGRNGPGGRGKDACPKQRDVPQLPRCERDHAGNRERTGVARAAAPGLRDLHRLPHEYRSCTNVGARRAKLDAARSEPKVRFWPKADIASCTARVRFWG